MTDREKNSDGTKTIADDITNNAPDVQQHAVDAEKQKAEAEAQRDKAGTLFDPLIHTSKPDGSPSVTKAGYFRRKAQKQQTAPSPSIVGKPGPGSQGKQETGQPGQQGDPRGAAIATVEMIEKLGMMLASDEFAYIKNDQYGLDERASGYDVFEQYYRAKGIGDFPPGIAVAVWVISYIMPRFTMPKTKSRFGDIKLWIKAKLFDRVRKPRHTDLDAERDQKIRDRAA